MDLNLFNTATRQIERFVPMKTGEASLYTCGMTVYYYSHVGHMRAYTNSDVLRRTLEYMGLRVHHVMNVTDVGHLTSDEDEGEDKLEVGARRENRSPWEIARHYEQHFFDSVRRSNILMPEVVCRATEHIDDMIGLIRRLEDRGVTYKTRVGVIFDTSKFPDYGKFARLVLDQQRAGARTEVDPERRNPSDFALWVTNQPNHIMQWDSPWGRGFPGWHIECSAMSMRYLGEQLDLHTGGIDHIPVHHTNEIAQSEAATGKRFVNHWFHTAFLNIDNTKMSKSLDNLFTLDDLAKRGISPLSLRYFYLGSSYRKALNFTWEALVAAQTTLTRIWQACADLPAASGEPLATEIAGFEEALGADLNTSKALAVMGELAHAGERSGRQAAALLAMDRVLGLDIGHAAARLEELRSLQVEPDKEEKARELAAQRDELRRQRKFAEADAVRKQIAELGFVVEDSPQGFKLRPGTPQA